MIKLHHLNCVKLVTPIAENVSGHCLLLDENGKLVLIDTGIGLLDTLQPFERIGKDLIDKIGYRFDEKLTAIYQVKALGYDPEAVTDCIISHLDNDHIGGLPDFPGAVVHVAAEELQNFKSGNVRYLRPALEHGPTIKTYGSSVSEWFGFEARRVDANTETEILLIPLFGHSRGHCGVALRIDAQWIFYVGDAYYLRIELDNETHPVTQLARANADDNDMRIASLGKIRQLAKDHPEIQFFGYHDIDEFRQFKKP